MKKYIRKFYDSIHPYCSVPGLPAYLHEHLFMEPFWENIGRNNISSEFTPHLKFSFCFIANLLIYCHSFRRRVLTLMLLVTNLANIRWCKNIEKWLKPWHNSSESTLWAVWGLSNEYPHDRVSMIFKHICVLVLWMKEASALEGLRVISAWQDYMWSSSSRLD